MLRQEEASVYLTNTLEHVPNTYGNAVKDINGKRCLIAFAVALGAHSVLVKIKPLKICTNLPREEGVSAFLLFTTIVEPKYFGNAINAIGGRPFPQVSHVEVGALCVAQQSCQSNRCKKSPKNVEANVYHANT